MTNNTLPSSTGTGYLNLKEFNKGPGSYLKDFIQTVKKKAGKAAIKSLYLSYALKGNNVECPCCNKTFITFLPAGISKRSNARCINCNSLERHRILWLYLQNKTNLFQAPLKVLNVAPEPLFYQKFSKMPNLTYVPIDKYPEEYGYGSKTIRMDVTDMTFAENTFDVIICNHVLEHVHDDVKAMHEMYRVLKPGGFAILNSPVNAARETTHEDTSITDPAKRLALFGQIDHVRTYGRDYTTRLQNAGFTVDVIDYAATFTHNERFSYGMKDGEEIYRCSKI